MFTSSIALKTTVKTLPADLYTPIGIYLRLRDRFPDTILLESAGHHGQQNNFSYIALQPIAGIEVKNNKEAEIKFPLENPKKISLENQKLTHTLQAFSACFCPLAPDNPIAKSAQGLFGYISYDAIPLFENLRFKEPSEENQIPLLRYRLYQYVIAINHFNDEMFLIENKIPGLPSILNEIESILLQKNVSVFPFEPLGHETSNLTDNAFENLVETAKKHCFRGDVFQLVLSRRFEQKFKGDEFNVYRALRTINPSPYLFFFDYGEYKLIGSSPESQLVLRDRKAFIHPIAGTFVRTGHAEKDLQAAEALKNDPKENAEHTMLVDLARNDLSIHGQNTSVEKLKEIQFFSHVIHMVSEVSTEVSAKQNPYEMIASTFPQGTLSGAPKYRAMQLIDQYEKSSRSFYGGTIGFVGFDGSCNLAIMIRTFLSKNQTLYYQAGAGIVAKSSATNERQEVQNKLNALKAAIKKAASIV
ncbi:anthranilate synthase component I family protein [Bergeyella sp. RCAD1439]|uniref:anthranilate synthase component I family protein n=1 Tax=Bergeyella anatis TaxID=3113737 RepID=UPI002E184BF8|nr:anthranilate synthase component I family protein [Bergeyella sp. RCAD1439]